MGNHGFLRADCGTREVLAVRREQPNPGVTINSPFPHDARRAGSRTQLTGVNAVSQFVDNFAVGYFHNLESGTHISVRFTLNRTKSNDAFTTFNPAWLSQMRYQVAQHVLNGFGHSVNTHSIRVAQNNKTISEAHFEKTLKDLVTQAQKSYWDLVFAAVDIKIKQDSLNLAEKTLNDNERQMEVGTLASIELLQSKARSRRATKN